MNDATTCPTAADTLVEAKDRFFFELSKLGANDQLRVILTAHQTAMKLTKLSPEQRAVTPIHGLL